MGLMQDVWLTSHGTGTYSSPGRRLSTPICREYCLAWDLMSFKLSEVWVFLAPSKIKIR